MSIHSIGEPETGTRAQRKLETTLDELYQFELSSRNNSIATRIAWAINSNKSPFSIVWACLMVVANLFALGLWLYETEEGQTRATWAINIAITALSLFNTIMRCFFAKDRLEFFLHYQALKICFIGYGRSFTGKPLLT